MYFKHKNCKAGCQDGIVWSQGQSGPCIHCLEARLQEIYEAQNDVVKTNLRNQVADYAWLYNRSWCIRLYMNWANLKGQDFASLLRCLDIRGIVHHLEMVHRAPGAVPGPETHPHYWDCECEDDYIHAKATRTYCERCQASASEQPDSMVSELLALEIVSY